MALISSSDTLQFINSASSPQTIAVTSAGYVGSITAAMLDGSFADVSPLTAVADVNGSATFTVTPKTTVYSGGDDAVQFTADTKLVVPIAIGANPANPRLPMAQSLADIISYVRGVTDCPTKPPDALVVAFLNEGLLQTADEVGPIRQTIIIPLIDGASTVTLPQVIQDIIAISYSAIQPGLPGSIPYPLQEVGTSQFDDVTMGYRSQFGYGGGMYIYRLVSDEAGRMRIEFDSAPATGYLKVVHEARPQLWDPADLSTVTNIDPAYVSLAKLFACREMCLARQNEVRAQSFQSRYNAMMNDVKARFGRRRNGGSGMVRDVMQGEGILPPWWPN